MNPEEIFEGKKFGFKPLAELPNVAELEKKYKGKVFSIIIEFDANVINQPLNVFKFAGTKMFFDEVFNMDLYRLIATIEYQSTVKESVETLRSYYRSEIIKIVKAGNIKDNMELRTFYVNYLSTFLKPSDLTDLSGFFLYMNIHDNPEGLSVNITNHKNFLDIVEKNNKRSIHDMNISGIISKK